MHSEIHAPAPASLEAILRLRWRALKLRYGRNRAEILAARRILRAGQTAVDAGAHKGAWTWWLQDRVGTAGRAIAFEPQTELAESLQACATRLRWHHVRVAAFALSSRSGTGRLSVPRPGSPGARLVASPSPQTRDVPLIALDDWFASAKVPPPAFIKADCEGHEPELLLGARGILESARPALLLELEVRHLGRERFHATLDHLAALGYHGTFFNHGLEQPLSSFRIRLHQRETAGAFWKAPDYCNNFLFRAARS